MKCKIYDQIDVKYMPTGFRLSLGRGRSPKFIHWDRFTDATRGNWGDGDIEHSANLSVRRIEFRVNASLKKSYTYQEFDKIINQLAGLLMRRPATTAKPYAASHAKCDCGFCEDCCERSSGCEDALGDRETEADSDDVYVVWHGKKSHYIHILASSPAAAATVYVKSNIIGVWSEICASNSRIFVRRVGDLRHASFLAHLSLDLETSHDKGEEE